MIGRTLVHGRDRTYGFAGGRRTNVESVSVEVHAHLPGAGFTLPDEFASDSNAKVAEALLTHLRRRGDDDIPPFPGFCIGRGVFAEPLPEHANEHIVFHLGLPGHPDMGLALSSVAGAQMDEGLLERVARGDAEGSADAVLRPHPLLQMETGANPRPGGKPVDSSLHQDAVLALWDRISSSIRLHTSDSAPAGDATAQPPGPGMRHAVGAIVRRPRALRP
ncbi:T6SS immunity protein Tli4 family protein [Telluria antibiotica]|nr:T6SS immunity protein Tli4 family protein [Telluria antibiotica]